MDNVILTNAAERSAAINIGGKEYELVLTTRATKAKVSCTSKIISK